MPNDGTILGINRHRNVEKKIFMTERDRMRHFYVIGQTGTGKSVLLKNLVSQDIEAGYGVCMIDPHGTDIQDVLGSIPKHREQDVIYFDPANLDMPIGLNMLEYDESRPEQKTFVVNELFSIFQKLYGANPESMGPMFEQYFRNATLLVMEDPESGNTLMDISRVMADAKYRRMKLEKAKNPVVVQFWRRLRRRPVVRRRSKISCRTSYRSLTFLPPTTTCDRLLVNKRAPSISGRLWMSARFSS
jgi:hypothetical protein